MIKPPNACLFLASNIVQLSSDFMMCIVEKVLLIRQMHYS